MIFSDLLLGRSLIPSPPRRATKPFASASARVAADRHWGGGCLTRSYTVRAASAPAPLAVGGTSCLDRNDVEAFALARYADRPSRRPVADLHSWPSKGEVARDRPRRASWCPRRATPWDTERTPCDGSTGRARGAHSSIHTRIHLTSVAEFFVNRASRPRHAGATHAETMEASGSCIVLRSGRVRSARAGAFGRRHHLLYVIDLGVLVLRRVGRASSATRADRLGSRPRAS